MRNNTLYATLVGQREPRRAKTLTPEQLDRVLQHVAANSNSPESDELKVLLSFRAGLRACEIAGLTMRAVTDSAGEINDTIWIAPGRTKGKASRELPMHPSIRDCLVRLKRRFPTAQQLAFSYRGAKMRPQSAASVARWFHRLYQDVGLQGCSSHSGRRTCLTALARSLGKSSSYSLRDVQLFAGHKNLETTQSYIDGAEKVRPLVYAL